MNWWRAQRIALIGLALAALATVGVQLWFHVLPVTGRERPHVISAEATVESGGHGFSPPTTRRGEFEAPEGSTTLSVRMRAQSGEDAERCRAFTLSEVEGDRVWLEAGDAVDVDSDGDESFCQAGSGSYRILTVFLLPDDAAGPFWFDVPVGDAEIVRFRIDG